MENSQSAISLKVSVTLPLGHAKTEIVSIWIGHGKLAQPPCLVYWRGVKWRIRSKCGVETTAAEGRIALIDIIDKDAVDGAEDSIS